jgi:hypothetical protein
MLFLVVSVLSVVVVLVIVGGLYLLARRSGFSREPRAGVNTLKTFPARKCRARDRIEQAQRS